MMEVNTLTMGDGLTVFPRDKDGWPAVRIYDALSVDNPSNCDNTPEWSDGVKVDGNHAHPACHFINETKPGAPWRALQELRREKDPAGDDYTAPTGPQSPGQTRNEGSPGGVPPFPG